MLLSPIQTHPCDISVIIVSYNTAHLLHEALTALRVSASQFSVQIIIVDNASTDESVALIRRDFPNCHLIENRVNVGFGRANNQALEILTGRYVLLLNTDAFIAPDTISTTVNFMDSNPECGILGVKLTGRDGTLQPSARYFPTPWNIFLMRTGLHRFSLFKKIRLVDDPDWNYKTTQLCDWVPGCYYLIRKAVIDEVGLFDPRYFLYCEEVDHCMAVKKAGWTVACLPETTVVHIGGESAKSDSAITKNGRQIEALKIESELLFFRKNYGLPAIYAYVFLAALADAINFFKCLLRRSPAAVTLSHAKHTVFILSRLRATQWGVQSTR